MRSVEDKEINTSSSINFEFHKGGGGSTRAATTTATAAASSHHHHRAALGKTKPTPSKWDDAQKWLVGLSREKNSSSKTSKPRNSNADDTRLIAPVPHQENGYSSGEEELAKVSNEVVPGSVGSLPFPYEVETKNIDCEESYWRASNSVGIVDTSSMGVRSVCVRDMGTEMTPIASLEPSRTATPIRATTPVRRSPIASGASTPMRCQQQHQTDPATTIDNVRGQASPLAAARVCNGDAEDVSNSSRMVEGNDSNGNTELAKKANPLETRAMAWDEAERAKYMARFKREEVKIQAWENHEKRKAEMEMKKMEVKAERLKARAQEKYANKLAAARRIAEEKRANAEANLNEKAVQTSEKADYIRRTGHLPSNFSFKLPSFCW